MSIETVAMECDDVEDLSSSRGSFFFPFPLSNLFQIKRGNTRIFHLYRSVMVFQLQPPSADLTLRMWTQGLEGGGVGSVLAKMTRCKPDQRRWSFCESVTAGARDGCEGKKKGGGAGDKPRREEIKLCTDLLLQTGTFTRAARFKRNYTC